MSTYCRTHGQRYDEHDCDLTVVSGAGGPHRRRLVEDTRFMDPSPTWPCVECGALGLASPDHCCPAETSVFKRESCDNEDGPGGVGSTSRGLTHSLDLSKEGLAMKATRNHPSPLTPADYERFITKFDDSAGTDGCWPWIAGLLRNGYGEFSAWHLGRQHILAHRASWEFVHGPIPDGLHIDHTCHTRACVNPAHLRLATNKQNSENLANAQSNSKSGVRGVSWDKRSQKWRATAGHNGKYHCAGYFDTIEEADQAVRRLRAELFTHDDCAEAIRIDHVCGPEARSEPVAGNPPTEPREAGRRPHSKPRVVRLSKEPLKDPDPSSEAWRELIQTSREDC